MLCCALAYIIALLIWHSNTSDQTEISLQIHTNVNFSASDKVKLTAASVGSMLKQRDSPKQSKDVSERGGHRQQDTELPVRGKMPYCSPEHTHT